MKNRAFLTLWTVAGSLAGSSAFGAQPTASSTIPDDATEEFLIEQIKRYAGVNLSDLQFPAEQRFLLYTVAQQQILDHADALVTRYPESSFREEALIIKLNALANLATLHPRYIELLLSVTEDVARGRPKGRLAAENAFAAIQAFVLGARHEEMPDERRLKGTLERYEAFLADYPQSERVPVIRASLIRNLIAQDRIDRARAELARLKQDHPNHKATRRAQGELYRATAVGRPFAFTYSTPDGETIRTKDYLGKVLLVHFWATWSESSMARLGELVELHRRYDERGLQLIGVNVDTDRKRIREAMNKYDMPWPHYFDEKGLENEVLVQTGVLKIPTYFVVDRKGILRSIDPGESLEDLVKKLLDESPAGPDVKEPSTQKATP